MTNISVFCDGGARSNPGPAGIGVVIKVSHKPKAKSQNDNSKIKKEIHISKFIGVATNNQAEYTAVIEALTHLNENYPDDNVEVCFYLDSQLVVEQLNGHYKLKNEGLKPLFLKVHELITNFKGKVLFTHIPREKNKEADRLVNEALDGRLKNV